MAKKDKTEDKLVNLQAAQLAAQIAQFAAQLEFQKERLRLVELPQLALASQAQIDELAFKKAESAWSHAFQEASVTGMYQGQPTLQWLEQQARMTGVIDGQQTLEGKLTDAQIAQMNHTMMLQSQQQLLERDKFAFQREQWDFDSKLKLEAQQAELTGYLQTGQKTFSREQWEADMGLQVMDRVTALQGPKNAFTQLDVLNAAQGTGLAGYADQLIGKTQIAGAGTIQGSPERATFQNVMQPYQPGGQPPTDLNAAVMPRIVQKNPDGSSVLSNGQILPPSQPVDPRYTGGMGMATQEGPANVSAGGTPTFNEQTGQYEVPNGAAQAVGAIGAQIPAYTYSPPGVTAPTGAYNYEQGTGGQTNVYPPGVTAPVYRPQYSTTTPQTPATSAQMSAGQQAARQFTGGYAPNKINAANYNRGGSYRQDMTWAAYKADGWDEQAAQDVYKASLPKYGGPKRGTVAGVI